MNEVSKAVIISYFSYLSVVIGVYFIVTAAVLPDTFWWMDGLKLMASASLIFLGVIILRKVEL
jgi:hypothetical protein